MGSTYIYECPDCGFDAMAGIGSGMEDTDGLEWALCSCPECGSLKFVKTKVRWELSDDMMDDVPYYREIQVCSECGNRMRYVDYWMKDGERKCPRCKKMNCSWEFFGVWD